MTPWLGARKVCAVLVLCAGHLVACGEDAAGVVLNKPDAEAPAPPRLTTHKDGGRDELDPTAPPPPPPPKSVDDAGGTSPVPLRPQDPDAGAQLQCSDLDCGLHGDCVLDAMDVPGCVCDQGYVARAGATTGGICKEDKSCITARILDCRWNGGSAIHAHFSLSYCSGNPYVGLDVADLLVDEKGNEEFEPLLPSESSATIIPHEVTAHVYVVLDVSNSITQSDVLDDVANGVKSLLDTLESQGGRYRFAAYLFDGKPYLYEFIADTDDLAAARTALDGLATQVGNDPSSSNVYGAVIEGIHTLDRAQTLRRQVSAYGVFTTGTLIVISDGDDRASTKSFADAQAAVAATVSNVITVGLGDVANYPKLTSIGRDGSYSASEPALIGAAFGQIADRIELVGKSLYFLGYCTPTRAGNFVTRIGVKDFDFARPTCSFNADGFVGLCDASTFDRTIACAGRQCGGPGCGECPAGSCCYAGMCAPPTPLPEEEKCGTHWMCAAGLTCNADECSATVPQGSLCGGADLCDLGQTYCGIPDPPLDPPPSANTCQPARADGSDCKLGTDCASLHCGIHPDYPTAPSKVCMPAAEMFRPCVGGNTSCEPGSHCDGTVCKPQVIGGGCTSNSECMTGNCVMLGSGAKVCGGAPSCLFSYEL